MGLTPFEQQCVELIAKLETVNLHRATLRLEAATRAVARAHEEIDAFKTTLAVYREARAEDASAPPAPTGASER